MTDRAYEPDEPLVDSDIEVALLSGQSGMGEAELRAHWHRFTGRFDQWPPANTTVSNRPDLAQPASRLRPLPRLRFARPARPHRVPAWAWTAAAAVVLAGSYLGWRSARRLVPSVATNGVHDTLYVGDTARIPIWHALPDGTRFMLARNSTLRVAGGWTRERTVSLTGDGYFTVTADVRPFIVTTGRTVTRVLGTRFFISTNGRGQDVRVGVLGGRVAVAAAAHPDSMTIVDPGYVAKLTTNGETSVTRDPDIAQNIAWTTGGLSFRDTPLADVLRELERRYGVSFDTRGASIDTLRFSVTYTTEPTLRDCLEAMRRAFGLRYVWYGTRIEIRRMPFHRVFRGRIVEWIPPDSIVIPPPKGLAE
jgi:ferric-dicitrate binding protein FerR (iron transport regulator)